VLSIVSVSFLLASCSGAILSIGKEEYSVIHHGSTKEEITEFLGQPIESEELHNSVSLFDIKRENRFLEFLGFPEVDSKDQNSTITHPEVPAVLKEKYSYTGRIQRKTDVGEAVSLAGYTWGLSELVMIPTAIIMQVDRSYQTHLVTIWYSESGIALAYVWETVPKNE
jgi:hypothetical protein